MTTGKPILVFVILLILVTTIFFQSTFGGKVLMGGGIILQIIGFLYIAYSQRSNRVINHDTQKPIRVQGEPIVKYWASGAWIIIIGLSLQFTSLWITDFGPWLN